MQYDVNLEKFGKESIQKTKNAQKEISENIGVQEFCDVEQRWSSHTTRSSSLRKSMDPNKMSCPLNRNRWAGSGYVKQAETVGSKELDARVAAMMAERDAQDTKSFPGAQCAPKGPGGSCAGGTYPMPPTRPAGGGGGGCSGGTCPPPKKPAGGK